LGKEERLALVGGGWEVVLEVEKIDMEEGYGVV
jgi:hypothetical protein